MLIHMANLTNFNGKTNDSEQMRLNFIKNRKMGIPNFQIKPKPKPVFFKNTDGPPAKKMRLEHQYNPNKKPKISIMEQRKMLPTFGVRTQLLDLIKANKTLIIMAETGSGKTTQIPQFIEKARFHGSGKIGITQPRKVAAISIATRVAEELGNGEEVGGLVGYSVRFEDKTSQRTKIKYLTDGMLLREAMFDKLLMEYTVIILDEAHERTIHSDVLLGIVKRAQKVREARSLASLKIIVMSATIDPEPFKKYFNVTNNQHVYIEGSTYPVQPFYTTKEHEDYQSTCISTFFKIHQKAPANHDVLIFLTGQEEIESVAHRIRLLSKTPEIEGPPIRIVTLYAAQSTAQQMSAFQSVPENTRKVIIATNIAETSVTISGIKYVIDSGMVKARSFHPTTGMEVLKVQRISQEQANQRAGRAGRESSGICYRLYTRSQFEMLRKSSIPEIQRANVATVALQLLKLEIHMQYFDFMDKPPQETIQAAFEQLLYLGAVESTTSNTLTSIGKQMVQFPIDPRFSKILISAQNYNCLEEALIVVSFLSGEPILINPASKREEAQTARERFHSPQGDHFTLLNIFREYIRVGETNRKKWCHKHFIQMRNIEHVSKIRTQLEEICRKCGFNITSCGSNLNQLGQCLLTGLFMNVAEFTKDLREKHYITLDKKQVTHIHPSSVIHGYLPFHLLFTDVVQTKKCYLRILTVINPDWLQEAAPEYMKTRQIKFNHS